MIQAQLTAKKILEAEPDAQIEYILMKTTGDLILDRTLEAIGGKGLFVKELDEALLSYQADITVHSYKDMPMNPDPRLPVVAVSVREDPRDVLILPEGADRPDFDRPVGCSSARRRLHLKELYPGWESRPVRGNLQTRLAKLERGEYGGLVLAAAGIRRLGLEHRISRYFSPEEMIPACCQGTLAVQARAGEDVSFLRTFHDPRIWDISEAERGFARELDGGCTLPIAAFGQIGDDDVLTLQGYYHDPVSGATRTGSIRGARKDARMLGIRLAVRLKEGHSDDGK